MKNPQSDSAAEKRELREDFEYCDSNRDGRIDYKEFCILMHNLEAGMSGTDLRIGFGEIDTDHDGAIDFGEFRSWWRDR